MKDPHLLSVSASDAAIRRRGSDSSRSRPLSVTAADIELAPLGSSSTTKTEGSALQNRASVISFDTSNKVIDVERASSSGVVVLGSSTVPNDQLVNTLPSLAATAAGTRSSYQRRWDVLHFAVLCYNFFLAGWNDGSQGPLLPTIQRAHNIGFGIVSLLFVFNAVGYVVAAVANVYLDEKYGFGKVNQFWLEPTSPSMNSHEYICPSGSISQTLAYVLLAADGPFYLMCIAFGFQGFGFCFQVTQGNTFVGTLEDASTKLGILHASYGLGALTAPLVATHFSVQRHWSFHYLVSASLAVLSVILICFVFRLKTADGLSLFVSFVELKAKAGLTVVEDSSTMSENKYKKIMGIAAVHTMSFWTLIYVGVEVTLGGWIVTFLQEKRGGGASAGYISSGFFGGLMMGRLLLIWLNRKIGEHRVMFIYAFLAIVLEATIWAVPSFLENAIAVSCIGMLLGPMYPILVHHSSKILPKWLYAGCIGWISGLGQTGSAILPFLTGLLASRFGITALQPFIVSMMSTMIVLWAFVPRARRID
ncbi:major facilitator superfamily domain-containing protein [Cytidiella melzeri]|nr:major facilitator superfamily domain-containing protein [Cytidiella melzeri]